MKKNYFALLFILNGTIAFAQNPQLLKDVFPGATGSGIQQIVKTTNYTFFNAEDDDADADRGLYRTDGTPAGTIKLNLTYPTYNSTKADKLTALGNKIIFAGDNFANYGEIWASDGTQAGTIALERFQPTQAGRVPVMNMAKLGTNVLYGVVDNNNHSLLKKTDGTAGGTTVIYDFSTILPGAPDLALFQEINGILYFNVYNTGGAGEDQLWRSDGTVAGTYLVKDFGLNQYVASGYMPAGNLFFLMIVTPGTGNVLWKSDGTAAGTAAVKTISTTGNNNYPQNIAVGSTLYFAGLDGNGKELWKTDGTAAGTVMVSDINPGTAGSNPLFFTLLNGNIFFSATTANEGTELWKFDGVNTTLVKDINPGTAGSATGSLVVSNNTILFRALTTTMGSELWITDGTASNTLQVTDINPGSANAVPNILTPGNPVYFSANNGVNGSEIFKYDNSQGLAGLHKLYVNDNNTSGDIFTAAVGNNANQGTRVAPVATVTYALTIAAAGDTIVVEAGTYTEQVIIDKGITIRGAGQNLTSFITPSTALVPAPGPFLEIGLFETTQGIGDVHISDLSITSNNTNPSQNIIIQSGGSVKNCKLINGGQGIFFRIESGARNALVENNEIHPNGIGVNCQGSGLSASMLNNTISNAAGYYAGIFAGLDFGPIVQLTVTNNIISNYFGNGLLTNSYTSSISQNSITGTGTLAIQQYSGNVLNATCNWFGTSDAELIKPKISGAVNYTPWLISGVDTDPVAIGFQPASGTCTGRQNKFYVNDNSQTGDVFTTAIGNNSNNGFSTAPFATIKYAVTLAQSGDTIYVDAGTYPQDSTSFTINKSVVILGSNFNISPNNITNKFIENTDRKAESIISNTTFFIGASNIGLKGFTLSPGNRNGVALSNAAAGSFSFIRNKVVLTSSIAILLTGTTVPNAAALSSSDYFITDNRFEKTGNGFPQAINLRYIKNVEVTNNAFVRVGTSTRTLNAVIAGLSGGVVDNFTMQNNVSEGTNNNLFTFSLAKATITGNKFKNYNNGLFIQTVIPGSTDINILNNTFETDTTTASHIIARTFDAATADSSKITITGNTLSINAVSSMTTMPIAINTQFPVTSINPVLKISGNVINFGGNFSKIKVSQIGGISLNGKNKNTIVDNNNVYFNGTEPDTSFSAFKASGIYLTHDGANTLPPNSSILIQNNAIKGFKNSISFYDFTASATNSYVGYGNLPAGVSIAINNNSFTGDSISINNGAVGEIINATCNWYGSSAAQNVSTKITAATVNYIPWLTNGTDNDAATGFQPIGGSCNGIPVDVGVVLVTNVTCNGAANGAINVLVKDGLAPFTYAWFKNGVAGFSSLEDLANLAPADYKLIVTDANGSIDSLLTAITEPEVLTAAATGINNICFGASAGSATVVTVGGTAPYTYLWNNGETTENISNLAAGIYFVTVTDANGCTVVSNYTVTQPTQLTAIATGVSTSCANSASVTASGGTGTYTYLWSNGASTTTINSISAGTYSVIVTDANGCTATASVTVTANEAFNPAAQVTDVSCYGGSNGVITVTNVNGAAPFQYSINGLNYQSSNVFNNLVAGTYTITVVDANGCTGFVTKTVNQPPVLSVILNTVQSTCFGTNTGSVNVTASGGSGAISFTWAGPNGFTSSQKNINNLFAGIYSLLITDNNGCTAGVTVVVPSFNAITINTNVTHISCKGQTNGAIDLTLSGGTGSGFSYSWNNGAVTEDLFNLVAGNYTVAVTDIGSGCVKSATITVTQPATAVSLTVNKTNATGCNSLGTITATGSGGTSPYQYKVDNGLYQSSGSFSGFYAGNYIVWIKDANGCTTSKTAAITDNGGDEYESNNSKNQAKLIGIGTSINARIALSTDIADWFKITTPAGAANYIVTLNHPVVNYNFNVFAAGNNTPALVPVSSSGTSKQYALAGDVTYYIQVTGALSYNCYTLTVSPIALPITSILSDLPNEKNIGLSVKSLSATAYPNPHNGTFRLRIFVPEDGEAKIELFTANGQKLVTKAVTLQKGIQNIIPFTIAQHGTIFYRIECGKNIVSGKVVGLN